VTIRPQGARHVEPHVQVEEETAQRAAVPCRGLAPDEALAAVEHLAEPASARKMVPSAPVSGFTGWVWKKDIHVPAVAGPDTSVVEVSRIDLPRERPDVGVHRHVERQRPRNAPGRRRRPIAPMLDLLLPPARHSARLANPYDGCRRASWRRAKCSCAWLAFRRPADAASFLSSYSGSTCLPTVQGSAHYVRPGRA
jgi:hypothetical protein